MSRRRRRIHRGPKPPLSLADVALPCLDEALVFGLDRVHRAATLHRALDRGHARVHLVEQLEVERAGREPTKHGGVSRELGVLEHDRLVRLIPERGELDVRSQLPVDRGRGRDQEGTVFGRRRSEKSSSAA